MQTEILDKSGVSGIKLDGSPYRVLIVDDSKFVKKQLGKILESEGYEVIATAAHGSEAEIGRASCRERV